MPLGSRLFPLWLAAETWDGLGPLLWTGSLCVVTPPGTSSVTFVVMACWSSLSSRASLSGTIQARLNGQVLFLLVHADLLTDSFMISSRSLCPVFNGETSWASLWSMGFGHASRYDLLSCVTDMGRSSPSWFSWTCMQLWAMGLLAPRLMFCSECSSTTISVAISSFAFVCSIFDVPFGTGSQVRR